MVVLEIYDKDGKRRFALQGQRSFMIGRGLNCDIVINDPAVSRKHARIDYESSVLRVTDLESRSGVGVNTRKIEVVSRLDAGDIINLGTSEIHVLVEPEAPEFAPEAVEFRAGLWNIRLPAPTQYLPGGPVERMPRVICPTEWTSVLVFDPTDMSRPGPLAMTLSTEVMLLRGAHSLADLRWHFKLVQGIETQPLESVRYEWGELIEINTADLGWTPGNTFHYLLITQDGESFAVYLAPTYFLQFAWEQLELSFASS